MIPLVGFLIISTNKNDDLDDNSTIGRRIKGRSITNLKVLGLWFIPVILIPLIWPVYAISIGQFDSWMNGVIWQTHRQKQNEPLFSFTNPLFKIVKNTLFRIDPVLLVVGAFGIIFSAVIKRDFFPLLWSAPFLIFLYFIGYISYWHFIPLIPLFCISAAILIADISNKVITVSTSKKVIQQIPFLFVIISAIGVFGLVSTTMLITTNVNSSYFKIYEFIVQHLPDFNDRSNNKNNKVTVISGHWWIWNSFWIPKYVLNKDHEYKVFPHGRGISFNDINVTSQKVLFILDKGMKHSLSIHKKIPLQSFYDNSKTIAKFNYNIIPSYSNKYPFTSMLKDTRPQGIIEIKPNYVQKL